MPVHIGNTSKKRTVGYRDAKGITRNAKVIATGTNKVRSVTVTTTSGSKNIVATVGTFDITGLDVGALTTGNDTNVGVANSIASVTDATHAVLTNNAAATDGVGTATTVTRLASLDGAKIRVPHITPSSRVKDDVPMATSMHGTNVITSRRGPA